MLVIVGRVIGVAQGWEATSTYAKKVQSSYQWYLCQLPWYSQCCSSVWSLATNVETVNCWNLQEMRLDSDVQVIPIAISTGSPGSPPSENYWIIIWPFQPGALRNLDLPKGPSEEGCFHWVIEHQSEHLWSSYCSSPPFVFVPSRLGNRIVVSYHTLRRILPGVMCHDRGDSMIWSRKIMESNLSLTKMPGVLLQNI